MRIFFFFEAFRCDSIFDLTGKKQIIRRKFFFYVCCSLTDTTHNSYTTTYLKEVPPMAPVFEIILLKKIHTSIKLLSIIVTFSVFIFNFKASAKLSVEEGETMEVELSERILHISHQPARHSVSLCAIRMTSLLLLLLLQLLLLFHLRSIHSCHLK